MKKFLFFLITTIQHTYEIITDIKILPSKYVSLRSLSISSSYGNSHDLNYYYTYLYLGSPPKKQSYILDTGSSITTSPCSLCTTCGKHQNGLYQISNDQIIKCSNNFCSYVNSKCSLNSQCSFSISYSEGSSISGVYIKELINFGDDYENKNSFEFPIGCTNRETHLFLTQLADGIMGLQNNDKSFISILRKLNQINYNIFSLCFAQNGGFFSIGEISDKSHLNNITYIKIPNESFYKVNLKFIQIGEKIIEVNGEKQYIKYNSIIDSGTTISYFPKFFFEQVNQFVKEYCNETQRGNCGKIRYDSELGNCFSFNNNNELEFVLDNIMPNITFKLEGFDFIWEPRNYYFNNSYNDIYEFCLGFSSSGSKFTFGSTWMRGYDIIFDRDKLRLGFAKANCNYYGNGYNNEEEEDFEIIVDDNEEFYDEIEEFEENDDIAFNDDEDFENEESNNNIDYNNDDKDYIENYDDNNKDDEKTKDNNSDYNNNNKDIDIKDSNSDINNNINNDNNNNKEIGNNTSYITESKITFDWSFKIFIATIFTITIILCLINYIIRNKCKLCPKKTYENQVDEITQTTPEKKENPKTIEIIEIENKT